MSERKNTIFKRREVQNIKIIITYVNTEVKIIQKIKFILKYYGKKNQIEHYNTAKGPNNLANAVVFDQPHKLGVIHSEVTLPLHASTCCLCAK